MSEPDREFLRRADVMEWLAAPPVGLTPSEVRKLIEQDIIKIAPLPGGGYGYARKSQVKEALGL